MKTRTITDEEAGAIKWLVHWTYEEVERVVAEAWRMSRSGETDSDYGDKIQRIVNTLTNLEKKL
jgi:hypothetical protein